MFVCLISSHPMCPTQDSLNAEIEDIFLGPTHPPPRDYSCFLFLNIFSHYVYCCGDFVFLVLILPFCLKIALTL